MSKFDVEAAYGRIVTTFEKTRDKVGFEDPAAVLHWMRKAIERELRAAVLTGREEAALVADANRSKGGKIVSPTAIRIAREIRKLPDP